MSNSKRKLILISNMYPSIKNIRYGIFVKNFVVSLEDNFEIKKTILTKKTGFSKLLGYLGFYIRIVKAMSEAKKEDLIYVHYPLFVAPLLCLFNRKYILNFHGSDITFNTSIRKVYSFFLKKIIIKYPIVIPSKYYEDIFLNQFKKEKEKLLVYPSGGINRTIFKPLKTEPQTNQFVIGFVSNFIEKKGWRVLLEAINILLKENTISNISLRLVGDGPDKEEILIRLKNLNIPYTLRSNLSQAELAEEYNLLDVFVFPTYRVDESLGLVGLEAMSCGVPVIASNMGGPKEYINFGENGLLFKPKDADDLANKIMTYNNYTGDKKTNMIRSSEKTAADYDSKKVKNELVTFLKNQ